MSDRRVGQLPWQDMLPSLIPCRIRMHDAHASTGFQLPARYTPSRWEHNQYSVELHLQRAIAHHPWRVSDPQAADLEFIATNISMWCIAGKGFSIKRFWRAVALDPILWATRNSSRRATPKFLPLQYRHCGTPWTSARRRPPDILTLQVSKTAGYVLFQISLQH